ncbi:MAG: gamma subclass chorismate mutase AroQ [Rhizonema sp. PD37]|nr:gamma subclass chorismate mutase AroQ [Rhizonema sp. PD37]
MLIKLLFKYSKKLLLLQITLIVFGLLLTSKPSSAQSLKNSTQGYSESNTSFSRYEPQIDKLLQLIRQRLLIQNDVARGKWNQDGSIEAPGREQDLLAQIRSTATSYGVDADTAAIFFQWQIFAGKLVQIDDFQTWLKQGVQSFNNVPDLTQVLRPSLDELSPQLLDALKELTPVLKCSKVQQLIQLRAQTILRGEGIDKVVRHVAIAPLIELKGTSCQDVSRLDGVRTRLKSSLSH